MQRRSTIVSRRLPHRSLPQYDVLLVLEEPQLSTAAMRYGLGWRETELKTNEVRRGAAQRGAAGFDDPIGPAYFSPGPRSYSSSE